MRIINEKVLVLRILVIAILLGFTYPFLPAKQQWQFQAAIGSDTADSLLNEYYEAPVEGALQFSMEHTFELKAGDRRIADIGDVRYVKIADRVWGEGRLWAIHLRLDAINRLRDIVKEQPDANIVAVIDGEAQIPLDLPPTDIGSPLYVDPSYISTDPYYVDVFFEPWYQRPYIPGGMATIPFPDYP
jgi:hypothetical protein